MRRQAAPASHRLNGAIEQLNQPATVLAMRIAAHRGFIDGEFVTTRRHKCRKLTLNDRHQRVSERKSVSVGPSRYESAAESVRPGNAGLQLRPRGSNPLQSLKLIHSSQSTRSCQ